jgi:hypothetical protein
MRTEEFKVMKSVLSKEMGWSWLPFFVKCLIRKRSVFKKTHWTNEKSDESEFAKRLAISAALYLQLMEKMSKEKAFEITEKIIVPIGCNEQINNVHSLKVSGKEPMEQLLVFYGFMGIGGVGRFVNRTIIDVNKNLLHYEVRNCFFARFYNEAGTPELKALL